MTSIRLLFVWHRYPTTRSGDSIPATELILHLSQLGHEISLISYRSCDSHDSSLKAVLKDEVLVDDERATGRAHERVEITRLIDALAHPKKAIPYTLSYHYSQRMEETIRDYLATNPVDVIVCSAGMALMVPSNSSYRAVMPLDALHQGYMESLRRARTMQEGLKYLAYASKSAIYERIVFRKFDVCIVVSEWDALAIKRRNPSLNVRIIPLGADPDDFGQNYSALDKNSILFFGDLSAPTNEEAVAYFAREIMPSISREIPTAKLLVAGNSPSDMLVSIARNNKNVNILGFVDNLASLISQTCIVVAPMLSGTGTKNKVLQAMAAGKAVVSTSIGARGIKCSDGVDIIICDSSKEFADSIVSLLRNPDLMRVIGENARKTVMCHHTWTIATESFMDALTDRSALVR